MTKLFTIITFICFSFSILYSQDLLIKDNGDTLTISVIEINNEYLIYHKIPNIDQRVFTTPRDKLIKIIYINGEEYIFAEEKPIEINLVSDDEKLLITNGFFGPIIKTKDKKLSNKEVITLFREIENSKAERYYRKGRSQNIWGNILSLPAGYILGGQLYNALSSNSKVNTTLLGVSIVGSIVAISLNVSGEKNIRKSIGYYNDAVILTFGSTDNGVGLSLSF